MIDAAKWRRCRSSRTFACCFHDGFIVPIVALDALKREEDASSPYVIPKRKPENYSGVEVLERVASVHGPPMHRRCSVVTP